MTAAATSPLSSMGEAALRLAARGFAVFPCTGKRPLTRNGCKNATKDPEQIRAWWTKYPDANIGLATGAVSGIVGIDIDLAPGGEESLAKLEAANGALPPTLTARTGSGGRHLLFRHPPGAHVGNSAGQLGRGLDVRGDGGYLIVPPSRHPDGGTYQWIDERDPADLSPWLAKLIVAPTEPPVAVAATTSAGQGARAAGPAAVPCGPSRERRDFGAEGGTRYGVAGLTREAEKVEQAPEGKRNTTLNKAAFAAGQLIGGGELDRNVAGNCLVAAGVAAGLPHDEALATVRSGLLRGVKFPRSAPPRESSPRGRAADRSGRADGNRGSASLETPFVSAAAGGTPSEEEGCDEEGAASQVPPWQPFPVGALPSVLARVVEEGAAAIGCDPSYIALPMLAVAGSAIGNSRTAFLKSSWLEPAVVWAAIVGDSGTAKSPAQDIAFRPLRRREEEEQREHQENLKVHKAERLRYEVALTEWRRDGAVGDPPPEPERPVARRFLVGDATTEAQAKILAENPRGMLLVRDELAGWFRSFDAYRGGLGGDTAYYLATHGARQHMVDRKSGDVPTIFIPRAALSISGAIQPGTLAECIGKEHRQDGLLARLLLTMPPKVVSRWTTAVVDPLTEAAYAQAIDDLLSLELTTDKDGQPGPVGLPLAPEAMSLWIAFHDSFCERQEATFGDEASALAKLVSYAARFALIHQLVRDPRATLIDAEAIRSGATLCDWFADEAVRVYAVLVETEEEAARRRLVEWVAAPPRNGRTTVRELMRGPREYAKKEKAEEALNALQDAKLGTWEEERHEGGKGRPTWVFHLADDASQQVKKGAPRKGTPSRAVPPAAADTIGESSLERADFCQQGALVSAGADGGDAAQGAAAPPPGEPAVNAVAPAVVPPPFDAAGACGA